jgi:hypothetical protein
LTAFGAPLPALDITLEDFFHPDRVVQLGLPPNRIDVITSLSGLESFEMAWEERVEREMEGRVIPFIGRAALVKTKRASGRRKDLADLEALGELPPL